MHRNIQPQLAGHGNRHGNAVAQPNNPHPIQNPQEDNRQFQGSTTLKISESETFGPEALKVLNTKYAHLAKQGNRKFNLSGTKYHPHPYAAFCRKHFNQKIVRGINPNFTLLDVGGHAIRTSVSTYNDNTKWTTKVHSMLPCVGFNDQLRHEQWRETLSNMEPALPWPIANSCSHKADETGLCNCTNNQNQVISMTCNAYVSIDSAYYQGVMDGIEAQQIKRLELANTASPPAFYTFHDYMQAYRGRHLSYHTLDKESKVDIKLDELGFLTVTSAVNDNPFSYDHSVINTGNSDTWYRRRLDKDGKSVIFVYNVVDRLPQGPHDYLLVRSQAFYSNDKKDFLETIFAKGKPDDFAQLLEPLVDIMEREESLSQPILGPIKSVAATAASTLHKYSSAAYVQAIDVLKSVRTVASRLTTKETQIEAELVEDDADTYKITVTHRVEYRDKTHKKSCENRTWTARPQDIMFALINVVGKYTQSDFVRVYKQLLMNYHDKGGSFGDIQMLQDAVLIAMFVSAQQLEPILKFGLQSQKLFDIKTLMSGVLPKTQTWLQRFLHNFFRHFLGDIVQFWAIIAYAPMTMLLLIPLLGILMPGAFAAGVDSETQVSTWQLSWMAVFLFYLTTLGFRASRNRKSTTTFQQPKIQWLKGTCVTDKNRLDIQKNAGRVPAKWKFRNKELDISGLNGFQAANKLGCSREGKIEAGRIGPILSGTQYYEPTVKHCCSQVIMAASIRACSNKLQPSDEVFQEWSQHFDKLEGEILAGIYKEGALDVDLDAWLAKYSEDYREKILKELDSVDLFVKEHYTYDSFPKKELQYTSVPADMKDTPLNNVKERQISGPSAQKKIAANAFVYALEGIADKYVKEYCGRKNWPAICSAIDMMRERLKDPIFGFADGSGFDMSQIKRIQERFTLFIKKILKCEYINLDNRITRQQILTAFAQSHTLRVKIMRGEASYEAEGRASGDGWTTFANTLLMISYWTFIFMKAGVPKDCYMLIVKGDDVLFGVERRYQAMVQMMIDRYMAKSNTDGSYGLGQITKFVKWGDLVDGDFLSNKFFYTSRGVRMIRTPDRVFQTTPWSTKIDPGMNANMLKKMRMELTYSKGSCMLAWAEGLPIFEVYARKLMALGKEGPNTEFNQYADGGRVWDGHDDRDACMAWMQDHYGITREEILEIEEAIGMIQDLDEEIVIPALDLFKV